MSYKWVMLGVIMLFLIGTISWAMPTPRQRAQAKIRNIAQAKGLQVKMSNLQLPRVKGEVEASSHLAVSYGLIRNKKLNPKDTNSNASRLTQVSSKQTWEIHRLNGLCHDGLPSGWCWQTDNKQNTVVETHTLLALCKIIEQLPEDVYAVAKSSFGVRVYWHENATPEELDKLKQLLERMLDLV